jgi:hypothetical protein
MGLQLCSAYTNHSVCQALGYIHFSEYAYLNTEAGIAQSV